MKTTTKSPRRSYHRPAFTRPVPGPGYRYVRVGEKLRPTDEVWSFGPPAQITMSLTMSTKLPPMRWTPLGKAFLKSHGEAKVHTLKGAMEHGFPYRWYRRRQA